MIKEHPQETVKVESLKFDRGKIVPIRKCRCGCGTDIPSRNRNGELFWARGHSWRGKSREGENRNQHGPENNNWRGGQAKTGAGYTLKRAEGHPRAKKKGAYVPEHILVLEKEIGRVLMPGEVGHHKNGIRWDNRAENLQIMERGEHSSHHRKEEIAGGKILFGGKRGNADGHQ